MRLLLELLRFSEPARSPVVSCLGHPEVPSLCAWTDADTAQPRAGLAGTRRGRRCPAVRAFFPLVCESSVSSSGRFRLSLSPSGVFHCYSSRCGILRLWLLLELDYVLMEMGLNFYRFLFRNWACFEIRFQTLTGENPRFLK